MVAIYYASLYASIVSLFRYFWGTYHLEREEMNLRAGQQLPVLRHTA